MSIWQSIVMGIIQGLTEFLPISSSGHLVIIPHLLGQGFQAAGHLSSILLVQWGAAGRPRRLPIGPICRIRKPGFMQALLARKPFGNGRPHGLVSDSGDDSSGADRRRSSRCGLAVFSSVRATGSFAAASRGDSGGGLGDRPGSSLRAIGWLDALWIRLARVVSPAASVSPPGSQWPGLWRAIWTGPRRPLLFSDVGAR